MNQRNPVILCVDDEEANLKLLEKLLVPRGYVVVCAASGQDALRMIKSQGIDLVLLDIIMPGMNGFEVCRQIKEDQKLKHIPVILITVLNAKQDRVRGIEAGAEDFLSKPFDQAEVFARIKILLKLKELNDERQRMEEALKKSHAELESKVQERTAKLTQANAMLQADIIERQRAEDALLESEERYRALFDRSLDLVYIHDFEGHFIDANEAALNLFGYKKEELRGLDFSSLLSEDQLPFAHKTMQEIRETGFQKDLTVCRLRLRNGNEVYVESKGSAIISKGNYTGIQVLARNITDRQKIEEELRKAKFSLDLAIDASQIGVWELDLVKDTSVRNLRHDQIFGYKEKIAEWGAKIFFEHIITEDRPSVQAAFDRAMKTEKLFFECRILWPDKSIHWITATAKTVRDSAGKPQEMIGTVTDITERKRAEESIRSSLAEKEVLLKEVHHRVKNNLMTIIGLIKMQGTKANIEMFNPLLLELEGRVRAMALVHESLYKSEDLAHVNMQNYIETMGAHIRAQFGAERDIRFSVQAVGVDVELDSAVPFGLILNELIANAYQHAFPGDKPGYGAGNCEINVSMVQENGTLMLTVADNGIGLPAEVNWKNPETIGLQLIRMLSHQINGSLEMERSFGTVFRLQFPIDVP